MAVLIGNNYLVWVAAPGGSPTYTTFGGQQDGTLESNRATFDASHKTSGTVALKGPGLRDVTINLNYVADLPDTGYTVVETAHKGATGRVLVQIRKDGAAGTSPDDVIFAAEMLVTNLSVAQALNGAVSGSVNFELSAVPTTDLVLA
jgi:hypothetical protein